MNLYYGCYLFTFIDEQKHLLILHCVTYNKIALLQLACSSTSLVVSSHVVVVVEVMVHLSDLLTSSLFSDVLGFIGSVLCWGAVHVRIRKHDADWGRPRDRHQWHTIWHFNGFLIRPGEGWLEVAVCTEIRCTQRRIMTYHHGWGRNKMNVTRCIACNSSM